MGSWHMTIFCKRTQVFRAPVLANKTSRRKLVGFVTSTCMSRHRNHPRIVYTRLSRHRKKNKTMNFPAFT